MDEWMGAGYSILDAGYSILAGAGLCSSIEHPEPSIEHPPTSHPSTHPFIHPSIQ